MTTTFQCKTQEINIILRSISIEKLPFIKSVFSSFLHDNDYISSLTVFFFSTSFLIYSPIFRSGESVLQSA
jgi:hypothetical protein